MHDLRTLRDNIETLREGMRRRGKLAQYAPAIDRAEALESGRRRLIAQVEEKKAARNANAQEVGRRKRAREEAGELVARGRVIGDEIAAIEGELGGVEAELGEILLGIPNLTLPEVPAGDESHNTVVRSWGIPRAGAGVPPHWETGAKLGLLDLERGAKVSGSGFIVYRGMGARLQRALMNFFVDLHTREHGCEEVWVPFAVSRASMVGTSQLPKFEEDMYALRDDPLYLVPTAEVPVTNLFRDEILEAADLPRALCAYTPCFRREAGSAGKDTRGLLRVHQFDKVEMVRLATPETALDQLELLTGHAERLLQLLGLPYRVVLLAAGDTGFGSAKTYDLEAWSPGTGTWLEVSSCSTFGDFQARRANIRYRPAPGEKPRFAHTLNGSGLAFPRTVACLLEHHWHDGRVTIPDALRPWLGADALG
ncbi:MAG: serine--tRNA ligase [Gemmatimonadetes bacterium]|nr:serine--tRNA ligase [Gemmatimonadota bacterium]